jgi:hypothetical protein
MSPFTFLFKKKTENEAANPIIMLSKKGYKPLSPSANAYTAGMNIMQTRNKFMLLNNLRINRIFIILSLLILIKISKGGQVNPPLLTALAIRLKNLLTY